MRHAELLIPVKNCRPLPGRFAWPRPVRLAWAEPADRLPLGQLRADLERMGLPARLTPAADGAAVRLVRDPHIGGQEAYRLTVQPDGIELRAAAAAGAYYGLQTLRDLLALHGRTLPAMRINDEPDFPRRGVYLDCSRGKVPKVKTVKQLIERLAHWKVNELQLYIENTFRYRSHPAIGRGYSPFTAADILAIQEHAARHHVRLVGSLASFGHMEKILSLPEYRHLAEATDFSRDFRGDLCPTDPGSIRLLADLYAEFLPLLKARDFNACCDETRQIGLGRSRKRAEKIGLGRLYLEFVLKIRRLVQKHGKRLNIWADIVLAHPEILPEIPRDIVMLNWDYSATGRRIDRTGEIAAAGLPLVCCAGTNSWQSHGTRMEQAVANVAKFARIARRYRAEGVLNTDWGDYGHRNPLGASLHGFAHGAAHSWHGRGVEEKDFTRRFCFFTFADRTGRLAGALRALGAYPRSDLYHAFVEPFDPNREVLGYRSIERADLKLIRRRLEQTRSLRLPKLKPQPEFEALALEEFDLARRMDLLACERTLMGRRLRAGRSVPARRLRRWGRDLRELADDFAALWRARNKPSRLRDNLRAMRRAAQEAEALAD